jgi:RING finger protein 113A
MFSPYSSHSRRETQQPEERLARERPAKASPLQTDDSSTSSADESGHRIKQRKKNTGVVATSSVNNKSSNKDFFATVFTADRNALLTGTNDATKQSSWFDKDLKDAPIKSFGPIKASTNVRTITVTDFAPDVCKDYKQTGFCGFG